MKKEFRLESIELYNVFNYRGSNKIDFSVDRPGNVFLFNIKNGGGKTSLFLGIKWGFYGFGSGTTYTKDGIRLTSKDFMNQDEYEEGRFHVKIRFRYDGKAMELRRECPDYRENMTILTIKTEKEFLRGEKAGAFVSQIIPPDYGDFFMFNGEVLQEIANNQGDRFKTDRALKLMGLKQLDDLRGILKGLQKTMTTELSRSAESGGRMAELQNDIDRLDEKLERVRKNKADLSEKLDDIRLQIGDLEERRRGYGDVETALDNLARYRKSKISLTNERDALMSDISQRSSNAFLLFIEDDLKDLKERRYDEVREVEHSIQSIPRSKGEYLHIQKDILSKHLETCPVCKSLITEDIVEGLQKIIDNTDGRDSEYSKKSDVLKGLKSDLNVLIGAINAVPRRLEESCERLYSVNEELNELQLKIDRIEDVISNSEAEAIKDISESLRGLYKQKSDAEKQLFENDNVISNTEKKLNVQRRNLVTVSEVGEEHGAMVRRLKYLDRLITKLDIIISSVLRSKRQDILTHANEVFMSITNKPDEYRGLNYDSTESFALHIVRTDGKRVLHPSSGEKHVIAISFLVSLSINTERLNPMMMDTPLSRLDPVHKANIGRTLASLDNQVLFLAQPGEMDDDTLRMFMPSVVKMYESRPSEGNQACIVEVDL